MKNKRLRKGKAWGSLSTMDIVQRSLDGIGNVDGGLRARIRDGFIPSYCGLKAFLARGPEKGLLSSRLVGMMKFIDGHLQSREVQNRHSGQRMQARVG